jgi:hypothetical protein
LRLVPEKSSAKRSAQGPVPGGPVPVDDPLVGLGVPTVPPVEVTLGLAVGVSPFAGVVVGGGARVPADGAGVGVVELGEGLGDFRGGLCGLTRVARSAASR